MLYSFEDLSAAFSSDLLNEAGGLLDRGGVMSPDVRRNGEVITSLVNRSGKRAYSVYIRVEDPAEGSVFCLPAETFLLTPPDFIEGL